MSAGKHNGVPGHAEALLRQISLEQFDIPGHAAPPRRMGRELEVELSEMEVGGGLDTQISQSRADRSSAVANLDCGGVVSSQPE